MVTVGRLKRRPDFLRVAAYRRQFVSAGFILQARPRADDNGNAAQVRVGFTASRKVGNAVQRNRARRRLKAAVARIFPGLAQAGFDYVLVARTGMLVRSFDDLLTDLRRGLAFHHGDGSLHKGMDEKRS